ncbi:HAD family hydrolase [Alkalicoccus daliensis]|uniref:Cof-type HAD-IIB family hydrolase n=1 Tax=Alkalicoccus daliensis TaxID=745820 RepID=A0A1H0INS5_9BACI|nr:HAD family hydrolase [Alkalicoccus daliensis]SDO33023.1 hypothetical protein SAMN04488053_11143 [Alkalicoccus daliensis]
MKIKAVFIDMDGTLLQKNNEISPLTLAVIREIANRGVHVFLATGRHLDITLPYHRRLGLKTPLICLNGAGVYDWFSLDPLQLRTIPPSKELHAALVNKKPRNMMIHTADSLYCAKEDEITEGWTAEAKRKPHYIGDLETVEPENILKYSIRSHERIELPKGIYEKNCNFIRWDDGFELVRKEVSKWSAIEYLLHQYGVSRQETAAFGDGPNDLEMIRNCGMGVAMGNAITPLKKAADFIAGDHEEDGLAQFLESYILNTPLRSLKNAKPFVV